MRRQGAARGAQPGSWDSGFHLACSLGTRSVYKRDAPLLKDGSASAPSYAQPPTRSRRPATAGAQSTRAGAASASLVPLDSIALLQRAASTHVAAVAAANAAGVGALSACGPPAGTLVQSLPIERVGSAPAGRAALRAHGQRPPLPPPRAAGGASRGAALGEEEEDAEERQDAWQEQRAQAGGAGPAGSRPLAAGGAGARGRFGNSAAVGGCGEGCGGAGGALGGSASSDSCLGSSLRLVGSASAGARDSFSRDSELLRAQLAQLQQQAAAVRAESEQLSARLRMHAHAAVEVDSHTAMLRTALATLGVDVRALAERRAAERARALRAARHAEAVAAPGGAAAVAAAAYEAARREKAYVAIRRLGPAVGAFVARASDAELADGADGDLAALVRESRAALVEVDALLRAVSHAERQRAREAAVASGGGDDDDDDDDDDDNLVVLTPEGRAVSASRLLVHTPLAAAAARPHAQRAARAPAEHPRRPLRAPAAPGGAEDGADDVAALCAPDARAAQPPPSCAPTPLPAVLAGVRALGEEAALLGAHVAALAARRAALDVGRSFRALDRDRDGVLCGDELLGLRTLGVPPFVMLRLSRGALGLGQGGGGVCSVAGVGDGAAASGTGGQGASADAMAGALELAAAAARRDALLADMGAPARRAPANGEQRAGGGGGNNAGDGGVRLREAELGLLLGWLHGSPLAAGHLVLWFQLLDMDGDGVLTSGDLLAAFESAASTAVDGSTAGAEWKAAAEGALRCLLRARVEAAAAASGAASRPAGGSRGGVRGRLFLALPELLRSRPIAIAFCDEAIGALLALMRAGEQGGLGSAEAAGAQSLVDPAR